jgi:glucosamine--fructose-6-phosphate aminotransferase (isomerizing)
MGEAWHETHLWRETRAVTRTLGHLAEGDAKAAAALLGSPAVRRVVVTGNGAAYYAAVALWLAALEGDGGPEVVALPAGLVARGTFHWRAGDAVLAVSTSGEMRDVVEALDAGVPGPVVAITASPTSTIGRRADALVPVTIESQEAVTHTQGFCGNVAAGLCVWAALTRDAHLERALADLPAAVAAACDAAERWVESLRVPDPAAAVVFGGGPAWAAALEGALLLKEVAGVPTEGVETREGATSAMYALRPGHLVVSVAADPDPLAEEAEAICAERGARVVRAPGLERADRRLAAVTAFPTLVALSAVIGEARGLNVDRPAWTDAYYAVARGSQ